MRKAEIVRTDELVASILDRLAAGETLRAICRGEGMPDRRTWANWVRRDPDLARRYREAREAHAEEVIDGVLDDLDRIQGTRNAAEVQAANVRLSAIKWALAVRMPEKYSERHTAHVAGAMTADAVASEPIRVDFSRLTDEELEAWKAMAERVMVTEDSEV